MAYQFLHIETYSEASKKVHGTEDQYNCAAQVLGEAMRVPAYSAHVEKPRKVIDLGGTMSVRQLQEKRSAILANLRETVTQKDGSTYTRKLRKDAATLYTEIHSHPLPADALLKDKQAHAPAIKEWIDRALTDFKTRMPDGIDWSAVMHLDEGFVHFHIIAINTEDPKLDANKLHAGKAAAAKLREELETPTAVSALPKPTLEKRPNKPKQPRPSKNRETQKKNNAKRQAQLEEWEKACADVAARNDALMAQWDAENSEHLQVARKARGAIPEKQVYTKALKELQDRYYDKVGRPCGLLRDGPRRQRLSTKQYDAQKATAKKIKSDLDRIERTAKRADEDAGTALDAKERYLQKEAELDAGIQAMDILVTQMASGEAEITEDGVAMTNTPPFLKRLFGPKPPRSKVSQLFRKIVLLLGRMDANQHTAPDQGHSPEP